MSCHRSLRATTSAFLVSLTACGEGTSGPNLYQGTQPSTAAGGAAQIVAYQQNIYVGTNVDLVLPALLSPDPTDDLPALVQAVTTLQETDFTVRAAAIAREVDRTRPHIISLNEISIIDVDLTPLGIPLVAHEDFLPELLAALEDRGLNYVVAGINQGMSAAPPLPLGAQVSVVDYDVLLVDADRVTVGSGVVTQSYSANIGQIATGALLVRGFVMAPLEIEGRSYLAVSTHFESDLGGYPSFDWLRQLQAMELLSVIPTGVPTLIMGDLNDVPGSLMYEEIVGSDFLDVWATLRRRQDGLTCCNGDDLGNEVPGYIERKDFIFARGFEGPHDRLIGSIDLYGDNPSDKFEGPSHSLWPADHAGLVASLVIPSSILESEDD